jgi:ribosomal protein L37AE/L43A
MADKPLMVLPPSALLASRRKGHAGVPGRGPKDETCGSCASLHRNRMASIYLKCELSRHRWTGGAGTDVKAKDPACEFWTTAEANGDG